MLLHRYRARIVDNKHPKGWHKAKIRVLVLWDDIPEADLPWAEYLLPLGARENEGEAMPCQVNDLVWVEFPCSGDTRVPLITGSCYSIEAEKSQLPQELFDALYEHKRHSDEPQPPAVQYGDKVSDLFGVLQQLTLSGDWCLTHKSSGTALHMTPKGELVFHTEGDSFRSSTGNTTENIGGELKIKVEGPASIESNADVSVKSGGATSVESSGNLTLKAGGTLHLEAGGQVTGKATAYDFK